MANYHRIGRPFDPLPIWTCKQEFKETQRDQQKVCKNLVQAEKDELLRKIGLDPTMTLKEMRKIVEEGKESLTEKKRARIRAKQRKRQQRILRKPNDKNLLAKRKVNYDWTVHRRQQNVHQYAPPEAAYANILRNRQAIEAARKQRAIEFMANLRKKNAQSTSAPDAHALQNEISELAGRIFGELSDTEEEEN